MKKKANIQVMPEKPMLTLSLDEAWHAATAMWQVGDVLFAIMREYKRGYMFVHELFDVTTGKLLVPLADKEVFYWLKFVQLAVATKIITEENFILTLPQSSMHYILNHGKEIMEGISVDRKRQLMEELFAKKAHIR